MSLARSTEVNFHVHDILAILKPFLWIITPLILLSTVEARSKSNSDTDYYWRFKDKEKTAYRGEFENKCWYQEFFQRATATCDATSRGIDASKILYDEVVCYKFDTYKIGRYDKHGDTSFEKCLCDVMDAADKYCTEQAWLTAGYTLAGIAAICCCACLCFAGYFCIKSGMISDCFESMSNQIINGTQRVTNSIQSSWNSALSVFHCADANDDQPSQEREMRVLAV
jgi:hypothetical protein